MGRLIDHLKLMEDHDEKFLNGIVKSIKVEVYVGQDVYEYNYDMEKEQAELAERAKNGDPNVVRNDGDTDAPVTTNGRCIVNRGNKRK